jgi:hypothetical protein
MAKFTVLKRIALVKDEIDLPDVDPAMFSFRPEVEGQGRQCFAVPLTNLRNFYWHRMSDIDVEITDERFYQRQLHDYEVIVMI